MKNLRLILIVVITLLIITVDVQAAETQITLQSEGEIIKDTVFLEGITEGFEWLEKDNKYLQNIITKHNKAVIGIIEVLEVGVVKYNLEEVNPMHIELLKKEITLLEEMIDLVVKEYKKSLVDTKEYDYSNIGLLYILKSAQSTRLEILKVVSNKDSSIIDLEYHAIDLIVIEHMLTV